MEHRSSPGPLCARTEPVEEESGDRSRVQNVPLPVRYPAEHNQGLWGGEGVVQGFLKKHPVRRRVPHFWVPQLRRSVVRSEVLDQHLAVTVTDRTISLIHRHRGFDHYLLQTKACDLKSDLALKLKRLILLDLKDKNLYPNDPVKKEEIYNKYKIYLEQYTEEEIEWYGLTMFEAIKKQMNLEAELFKPKPLKHLYRAQLLQKLRDGTIPEVVDTPEQSESWFSKMNPFKEKDSSHAHPS
ncbi:large ribosomal subunit protein bL28m isoform X3 [Bacillus rossius redtenbacheri]|uniref:large ribosomal subunit protein bL28m isoform X3 n=1 Tax=Bacillus rossius redtenbacheri TaxID=93214 RepID=UPI002FDE86F9